MTADSAYQIQLFLCVVDALVVAQCHKRHAASLIVAEVQETALAAQALFPGQHPALAQHAVDVEVAGVEARPLDGHKARQAEVGLIDQQFAPGGGVDRVAVQASQHFFGQRGDAETNDCVAEKDTAHKAQCARPGSFQAGLQAQLGNAADRFSAACHHHQNVHGVADYRRHLIMDCQVAMGAAADEDVGGARADFCAAGQFVAFARCRLTVDEDVAGAFCNLDDRRVLVTHSCAFDGKCSRPTIDEHVGRGRIDLPRRRAEGTAYAFPDTGKGVTRQSDSQAQ